MGLASLARPGRLRRPVFYGWWIVLACGCLQTIGSGFFYYGLGNFFLPLTREFGWSRALTSSAFSLDRFQGVLFGPAVGLAFDRLGPRKLITVGVVLAGAGFIAFSQVRSFPGFLLAIMLMSAGFNCGFGMIGMATVANWFIRRRTTALGLLMAGAGTGGLLVPALAWLIERHGWRSAALVVGLLIWALGLPLSRVVRHRPEAHGCLPDGDPPEAAPAALGAASLPGRPALAAEASFGVAQALRTRAFWLLALVSALSFVSQSAMVVHAIPHLTGVGLPATMAASVVATMTVVSVAGRIGFGWLGDRLQKRYVLALLLGLQVAGLVVFALVTQPWHLAPFLALYAPAYGGIIPLRPALQGEYFGRRAFGAIQGTSMAFSSFGGMLGPVIAGWTFDVLGSYQVAFLALAAVSAGAVPAALLLPAPRSGK